MRLGFAGSREGLTIGQYSALFDKIKELKDSIEYVQHGDGVGADKEFHNICLQLKIPVHIWPPYGKKYRAFCGDYAVLHRSSSYVVRTKMIVDHSTNLIACPKGLYFQGSNTWATISYAKKIKLPYTVIYPEGKTSDD